MNGMPTNGALIRMFRNVGIVAGALIALSAIAAPPVGFIWWFATRPIEEKLDILVAHQVRRDSMVVREIARLTAVGQSNRELVLLIAEMNRYEIGSHGRVELWKRVVAEDRRTQRKLEP